MQSTVVASGCFEQVSQILFGAMMVNATNSCRKPGLVSFAYSYDGVPASTVLYIYTVQRNGEYPVFREKIFRTLGNLSLDA
jgi:hypothetical protein